MSKSQVREMSNVPEMEPNVSEGSLIWHRHGAVVTYECKGPDWPNDDDLVAVIAFEGCIHAVAGGPNDEAFQNHPLQSVTGWYSMSELASSEWMLEQCRMQDKDGNAARLMNGLRHYVLAFKGNTVELLAKGYRLVGVFPKGERCAIWGAAVESFGGE